MIGREYRVLVEGPDRKDGFLSARTEGKIIVRFPSGDNSLIGQFTTVKVTAAASLSAEGSQIHDVRTGASPRSPRVSSTPSRIPASTSKT